MRNFEQLKNPAIMLDEIGYWASAAYFKGYNWSGVIGNFASYYSYGYSFLLYLFMNLGNTPEVIHQIAIFANIIMVLLSFLISIKIIKKLYSDLPFPIICIACFTAFFYPSVQYHTQVVWSETYLMFMFICTIYVAIKLYEKPNIINHIIFVLLLFNLYIIHQRSLGIVLGGLFYTLWISIINKENVKNIVFSILILLILMCIGVLIKNDLYQKVFTNTLTEQKVEMITSSVTNGNDYGGQVEKIKYIFTLEGFYNFLISFGGKFWYFGLASFFIGFNGFIGLIRRIKIEWNKYQFYSLDMVICVYILSAYVITALIAAIFMIDPSRWDTVAYGRYTDWIGVIIIIVGIINLYQADTKFVKKEFIYFVLVSIIFLLIFWKYAADYSISGFFASCSQIMLYFKNIDSEKFIIIMTLFIISIGAVLSVIVQKKIYLIASVLIFIWTLLTTPSITELITIERKDWIYPVIEYIEENHYENIYYLYSDNSTFSENAYTGGLQYLLMEHSLYCIKDIDEIKLENPCIIIGWSVEIPEGYSIVYDPGFYKIIQKQ